MVAKRTFSAAKFEKLITKHFKDTDSDILNEEKLNGIDFFKNIKTEIENKYPDKLVKMTKRYHYYADKNKENKRFHISLDVKNDIIYTQEMYLLYENNCLKFAHSEYKLGDIETICKFIDEYLIKIEEEVKAAQKKNKVKKLKTNAAVAKIEELASELQFSYIIIDEYITKVKLVVKFEKSLAVEIDVTISKYKEILENLKELIISIRKLQELGIKTRWKSTQRYLASSWIAPRPKN